MLVVTEKTEVTLLETLRDYWEKSPTHRCLHLKISQIEHDVPNWFDRLLEKTRQNFDEHNLQIYRCLDDDVFILTRFFTHKSVENFLQHISPIFSPATLNGAIELHEIGVGWAKLRTICEKKIEIIKIQNAEKRQKAAEKEALLKMNREKAINTMSEDLVTTIAKRREQRETAEVMLVEDDLFSQKLIKNALKNKYSLSITGDGQGALMSYVNKAPDVLFLDIGLPDINGHEVLEKLFKIDPDAYVVMFSGNGDKDNVMQAIELGAKGFIGKPFTPEKLMKYIQKSPFINEKQNREKNHGNLVH